MTMKTRGNQLYNEYRPKSWNEILGQNQSIEILKKQSQLRAWGHSYLLYGNSGTGKTTTARVLAMTMNCVNLNGTGDPCGICQSCRTILEGINWDVLEVDGASERGIDDIRDLKYKALLYPIGKKRVFIIDEAHQITNSAFDALLKLLEEPPPHLCLILCSTVADKIPETVKSRCQIYPFHPLKKEHISQKLEMILKDWGMEISPDFFNDGQLRFIRDNLEQAIRGGNMRACENVLEQIIALRA